jgi:hypothetical protein
VPGEDLLQALLTMTLLLLRGHPEAGALESHVEDFFGDEVQVYFPSNEPLNDRLTDLFCAIFVTHNGDCLFARKPQKPCLNRQIAKSNLHKETA